MNQNEIDAAKFGVDVDDLYCSRGPVSSLPGSTHSFPQGSKCDIHEDRFAVSRVQGETDSFGCEYILQCQECVDASRRYYEEHKNDIEGCEWCNEPKAGCRDLRDPDEGMSGRVYRVCKDCITKLNKALAKEAEEYYNGSDDYDDSGWV